MAKDYTFQIKGVDKLVRSLQELKKRKANQFVKEALNPWPDQMARAAGNRAPVDTGTLSTAMRTRKKFVRRGRTYVADAYVDASGGRSDPHSAYYAHWVEFGHFGKIFGRTFYVPPQPFWEPSFVSVYGPGGMTAVNKARADIKRNIEAHFAKTMPKETR